MVQYRATRRDFLKLMAASGLAMTFMPFVEWGKYLPDPSGKAADGKTKILQSDGSPANRLGNSASRHSRSLSAETAGGAG